MNLDEIIKEKNALGALVIRKDGYPVTVKLPPNLHTETLSIMIATVYGAAYTSTTHMKNEIPTRITIETDSLLIEISPIEENRILAVITEK